jgi:hypothetical protein
VFGTVQLKDAGVDATLELITVHDVPPFVLYSSFTLLTFELVHVIFWPEPIFHTSPPFGLTTVITGWTILNIPLVLASTVSDAFRIRTLAFTLGLFGTVQL